MPSELSASIAERMLVAKAQGKFDQEYSVALVLLRLEIDDSIQEVRDVLPLLAPKHYVSFEGEFCWCVKPTFATKPEGDRHDTECQRVRALMARLRVDGKGDDG